MVYSLKHVYMHIQVNKAQHANQAWHNERLAPGINKSTYSALFSYN